MPSTTLAELAQARRRKPTRAPAARTESEILREVLAALNREPGVHVGRNNVGAVKVGSRFVRFGTKGATDIVGYRSVRLSVITKGGGDFEYETRNLAVHVALEVKRPNWKPRNRADALRWAMQQATIERVKMAGGIAGVVTSAEEAVALVRAR